MSWHFYQFCGLLSQEGKIFQLSAKSLQRPVRRNLMSRSRRRSANLVNRTSPPCLWTFSERSKRTFLQMQCLRTGKNGHNVWWISILWTKKAIQRSFDKYLSSRYYVHFLHDFRSALRMSHSNHVENRHNVCWTSIIRIKWAIQCKISLFISLLQKIFRVFRAKSCRTFLVRQFFRVF